MSIATWKKEFYPTPADQCTAANALDHSIRLWEGARKSSLKAHGLRKGGREGTDLIDDDFNTFFLTARNHCALCLNYRSCMLDSVPDQETCPIARMIGGTCFDACDVWHEEDDARPMLTLLKRVKREMAKRAKTKKTNSCKT